WLGLMMSILLQKNLFLIPFRGSLRDTALLSLWMSASAAAFSIMVSVWVKNKLLATQINAILFIPSTIIVGYTWPLMAMPEGYQKAAFYMPFHHYVHNLRNIFLKGTPLSSMGTDIHWFMGFMAIVCLISLLGLFRSSSSESLSQEKEVEALGLS
ncbi:MAG: ABC transporter permease, partial [Thermotaleaceae bacterium]